MDRRNTTLIRGLAALLLAGLLTTSAAFTVSQAQGSKRERNRPQSSHLREAMTPEERDLVERAIDVVCLERVKDPKGSWPIDDMQGRPSLPLGSPEAVAGAERAQRLLPIAKELVTAELKQLARQYDFTGRVATANLRKALNRVQSVRRIKPDMESRDNASVFLRTPHTITFGTIFLAGLPSDEGMVSVIAHELTHIADGDDDGLKPLFRVIGDRAANLIALPIRGQRAEELTCDLIGALAARAYVTQSPSYEPLPRRIARSVEHNCVTEDEGDEDHLSPRSTIRALMALDPWLTRELVYGREEKRMQ